MTNSLRLNAAVSTPLAAVAGGSGRLRPTPGLEDVTRISPRVSDTRLAQMNQPSARRPTRPSAAMSPICAMPTTSVEKTSGAMIILISRRNKAVTMPR